VRSLLDKVEEVVAHGRVGEREGFGVGSGRGLKRGEGTAPDAPETVLLRAH
jgi:hypothetical protein